MGRFGFEQQLLAAAKDGRVEEVESLLSKARPFLAKGQPFGSTAVSWAAYKGRHDCLSLLIAAGCGLHGESGSAAISAAMSGQSRCLALLIEAGCDLAATDRKGWDAADYAAHYGHPDCVEQIRAELDRRAISSSVPSQPKGKGAPRI